MKIAVIGGGVFGCTIAIDLARAGVHVDLFEAQSDILMGTTDRCQARLHRGYHYPRSDSTAAAARDAFDGFRERYPDSVRTSQHHYVIAPGSKVAPDEYLRFCDRLGLPYTIVAKPPNVHTADMVVKVPEAFVDVAVLRRMVRRDLALAGVTVRTDSRVGRNLFGADLIIWATYGSPSPTPLRYEVCEVALVELGRYARDESYVVIDGEFVSLDPFRGVHALYDVKHSVLVANEGTKPIIPSTFQRLIERPGPVKVNLRLPQMMESAGRFLRHLDPSGRGVSIYHGSLLSVRAVLPDVDATDARPTLVERDGDQIRVLSGKICTAVAAARQVTEMAMVAA